MIKDPLSVLKLRLPPNGRCPNSAEDPVSSLSEVWTVKNPRGGTNHKNFLYSARNLLKLAITRAREVALDPTGTVKNNFKNLACPSNAGAHPYNRAG
ncbi:hypothetical protein AVEN_72511-1 [Araneus ventricosus]|uniref:Uncharacterized protein n=1 Tax=Araneus ventricosus TaxID=182803 RepID=A0A4Y2G652_ARAVE|nr:hypothetical protein AVEN_72511-1 [Araneus ventricosus]